MSRTCDFLNKGIIANRLLAELISIEPIENFRRSPCGISGMASFLHPLIWGA